ncbi:MAG: hypothetical protein ABI887_15545 [Burkholderiales bacterium]
MSNTTITSTTFKLAAANGPISLLRELFRATPLYIFATAAKAALQKPARR